MRKVKIAKSLPFSTSLENSLISSSLHFFRSKLIFKPELGLFKKSPYFVLSSVLFIVLPSDSEASLTSFGTASLLTSFGTASLLTSFGMTPWDVIPRHASAEGPPRFARDDKKVGSGRHPLPCPPEARKRRGTPRFRSGRQKRVLGVTKKVLGATKKVLGATKKKGARGDKKRGARGDSRRACTKTFLVQPQPDDLVFFIKLFTMKE